MSGAGVTLDGFIEARIAEDEQEAKHLQGETDFGLEACGDRILAECHAKRRAVQYYRMLIEQSEHAEVFGYHATGLKTALRFIAAVYKDHPDYREEWQA